MESKLPCGQSTSPTKFSMQRLKKTCHVKKRAGHLGARIWMSPDTECCSTLGLASWLDEDCIYLHCWTHKGKGWELGGDNWFFSTLKVTHVWFNWKDMSFFFWSKSHWLSEEETLAVFEIWVQNDWIVEGLGSFQYSKHVSLEEKNGMTTAFCHSMQKTFVIIINCIFYTLKRGWCYGWVPSRFEEFALLALVTDFFLYIYPRVTLISDLSASNSRVLGLQWYNTMTVLCGAGIELWAL